MKLYAFKSLYGYNSSLREGQVMKFTSRETLKYVLEVNLDLVEIMSVFRLHLTKKAIEYNRIKKFLKKYKIPQDLFKRELGLIRFTI